MFSDLSSGQKPFAAVLGCADSRVPVEMVLDQGPGQLFVIRVAGNLAGQTQIGSLEFAVEILGIRLILVLGHTGCGAVGAALEAETAGHSRRLPENLGATVARISRILRNRGEPSAQEESLSPKEAECLNIQAACRQIVDDSRFLATRLRSGDLVIQGAIYDLETGRVELLEPAGSERAEREGMGEG